jgi:hypothetical protein
MVAGHLSLFTPSVHELRSPSPVASFLQIEKTAHCLIREAFFECHSDRWRRPPLFFRDCTRNKSV